MVLFVPARGMEARLSALIIDNILSSLASPMVNFRSVLHALNVNVEGTRVELDDPNICPACHKRLNSAQGVMAHLSNAPHCQWYKKGKLKELTLPGQFAEETVARQIEAPIPMDVDEDGDADPASVMQDHYDQLFDLLPTDDRNEQEEEDQPGPSRRSWQIPTEDEGDDRVVLEHPTAGRIIRMNETLHERWKKMFRGDQEDEDVSMDGGEYSVGEEGDKRFAPFASELDWRVARWAVQEGVGHKSFDRLMAIPGVSGSVYTVLREGTNV